MKVVHIVTFDFGGAAIAAIRISESLNKAGCESEVFVRESRKSNVNVINYSHTKLKYLYGKSVGAINKFVSNSQINFTPVGIDISSQLAIKEADVIFLHWTNKFLSLKNIEKLVSLKKKVVIVLHDMWWFTGGCNYDEECTNYNKGCKKCKFNHGFFSPHNQWKRKMGFLKKENVFVISLCNWMLNAYNASVKHSKVNVFLIKNPINTFIFKPLHNRTTREKYRIGFGADQLNNVRKGFDLLIDAIKELAPEKYELVVFGNNNQNITELNEYTVTKAGYIDNEEEMVELLNGLDVLIAPSRQENYANVVLEALSCGIPVVAFHIGGMPDFIEHQYNGYLAKPFDTKDLAKGIAFCAINSFYLGKNARKRILKENTEQIIAEQYLEMIDNIACE